VNRINAAGMYAILDLHWNAPDALKAVAQQAMADADHSPAFWKSVATTFRRNPAVIFDLYNEPYVAPWNASTDDKWQCWLKGCIEKDYSLKSMVPVVGTPWLTAGMQSLVDAVRATGARQPLMLTGQDVGSNFLGFLSHLPVDPVHQLIAQAHVYNNSSCANLTCWQGTLLPVARKMPMVIGELGEYDCAHGFIDSLMAWSDSVGVSYLAWAWVPWAATPGSCRLIAGLILDWNGTPTAYGSGFRAHLIRRG
jgi:hypothetical protein